MKISKKISFCSNKLNVKIIFSTNHKLFFIENRTDFQNKKDPSLENFDSKVNGYRYRKLKKETARKNGFFEHNFCFSRFFFTQNVKKIKH